ncbi:MAG TPA: hypothetical protein VJ738_11890 [Steroidobacteraceae bacterium]|nr:hypothetical protein [Steroidobacteraceae bacterium]
MAGPAHRLTERAIGITVHTGWGACVVVGGSLEEPEIIANSVIELLKETERFCYHRAAQMKAPAAREWLTQMRAKALAQARSELAPLMDRYVRHGAIVAKEGPLPEPEVALASHMRIHSAEGLFYRDVFREACRIPCRIVPPASLDVTSVGRFDLKPWGRDQKLAALAAWAAMSARPATT